MTWFDNICSVDKCQEIIGTIVQIIVTIGLIYGIWVIGSWLYIWWEPDYDEILAYINVKGPQVIIGTAGLMVAAWVYDILTPGSFQKQIASNPMASAIFMGSLVLGLAMVMSR